MQKKEDSYFPNDENVQTDETNDQGINYILPVPQQKAAFTFVCSVINIIIPGLGLLLLTCGSLSDINRKCKRFYIIGILQLLTAIFIIGWIWAICNSVNMILIGIERLEKEKEEDQKLQQDHDFIIYFSSQISEQEIEQMKEQQTQQKEEKQKSKSSDKKKESSQTKQKSEKQQNENKEKSKNDGEKEHKKHHDKSNKDKQQEKVKQTDDNKDQTKDKSSSKDKKEHKEKSKEKSSSKGEHKDKQSTENKDQMKEKTSKSENKSEKQTEQKDKQHKSKDEHKHEHSDKQKDQKSSKKEKEQNNKENKNEKQDQQQKEHKHKEKDQSKKEHKEKKIEKDVNKDQQPQENVDEKQEQNTEQNIKKEDNQMNQQQNIESQQQQEKEQTEQTEQIQLPVQQEIQQEPQEQIIQQEEIKIDKQEEKQLVNEDLLQQIPQENVQQQPQEQIEDVQQLNQQIQEESNGVVQTQLLDQKQQQLTNEEIEKQVDQLMKEKFGQSEQNQSKQSKQIEQIKQEPVIEEIKEKEQIQVQQIQQQKQEQQVQEEQQEQEIQEQAQRQQQPKLTNSIEQPTKDIEQELEIEQPQQETILKQEVTEEKQEQEINNKQNQDIKQPSQEQNDTVITQVIEEQQKQIQQQLQQIEQDKLNQQQIEQEKEQRQKQVKEKAEKKDKKDKKDKKSKKDKKEKNPEEEKQKQLELERQQKEQQEKELAEQKARELEEQKQREEELRRQKQQEIEQANNMIYKLNNLKISKNKQFINNYKNCSKINKLLSNQYKRIIIFNKEYQILNNNEFSLYFYLQIQLPQINKQELAEAQLSLHINKQNTTKQIEILKETFNQLFQNYNDLSEFQKERLDSIFLIVYNLLITKKAQKQVIQFFYSLDLCKCIKYLNPYAVSYLSASLTYLIDKDQENCLIYLKQNDTISLLYYLIDFEQIRVYQLNFVYKYLQTADESVHENLDTEYKRSFLEKILRHYAMCLIYDSDSQIICLRIIQQLISLKNWYDAATSVRVDRALLVQLSSLFIYSFGKSLDVNKRPQPNKMRPVTPIQQETFTVLIQTVSEIYKIYKEIPDPQIKEQTLIDFIDICSSVDMIKILQFFILWSENNQISLLLLNLLTERKSFVNSSVCRCADHDCMNILTFTMSLCRKTGQSLKLLANILKNSDLQQFVVKSELFKEIYDLSRKYIENPLYIYDAIEVLSNMISFPQTLIDYSKIDFPDWKKSQKSVVSDMDGATLENIFNLALNLCQKDITSQNITLLYLASQFRVNLMPFLHQVSTLELVQRKFEASQSTIELPTPNMKEIEALIIFIRSDNAKCRNHSIQALTLLSRVPQYKKKILCDKKEQILENLSLQSVVISNNQVLLNKEDIIQTVTLSLKLICYINLNSKITCKEQCQLVSTFLKHVFEISMNYQKDVQKYSRYLKCLKTSASQNLVQQLVKDDPVIYDFIQNQ